MGPTFRASHMGLDKAFCQPHTFHSPSFLTLRMTPLRISAGKVERAQDIGFGGPNTAPSLLSLGAGPPSSVLFTCLLLSSVLGGHP